MEITEKERAILEEIARKREAGKYKWTYLLFDIVQEKRGKNIPFDDIAEWLSKNGLEIKSATLRKMIWDYKNKVSKVEKKTDRHFQNPASENKPKPAIRSEPVGKIGKPNEKESQNKSGQLDLDEVLREREKELKMKNSGFDQFDDL